MAEVEQPATWAVGSACLIVLWAALSRSAYMSFGPCQKKMFGSFQISQWWMSFLYRSVTART